MMLPRSFYVYHCFVHNKLCKLRSYYASCYSCSTTMSSKYPINSLLIFKHVAFQISTNDLVFEDGIEIDEDR